MAWLNALKAQIKEHGQRTVAERLGVSVTVVSQVVNEKYPGNLQRIQALVESIYLDKKVQCPVLGCIAWHQCQQHQKNEHTSNPVKLRLYRACRSGCPNSSQAVTQNIQLNTAQRQTNSSDYDANAVITRLKRQAETDGKHTLNELLQEELKHLAMKYNRLNRRHPK